MSLQTIKGIIFGIKTLGEINGKLKDDLRTEFSIYEMYFDWLCNFTLESKYNAFSLFLYLVMEDFLSPSDDEIEEAIKLVWIV